MGNENKALDVLISKVMSAIDSRIRDLKYDKTFKATIWKINSNGTYSVNYKGQLYDVINATGMTLALGQTVWVKIPCGILRNMHICNAIPK